MKRILRILDDGLSVLLAGALVLIVTLHVAHGAADIGDTTVVSQTDGSNNSGTTPTWAEGMAPSQVNDSARALQGSLARWYGNLTCGTASTGTDTIAVSYTVAPAAYRTGQRFCFEAGGTNTGSATLNVNSLGAKTIQREIQGTLTNLAANTIRSGQHVEVVYDSSSDVFIMQSPSGVPAANIVTGPGSVNDLRCAIFDGTSGALIKESNCSVDDTGTGAMQVRNADAGANAGPMLRMWRNSASPAASDYLGELQYRGNDSGATNTIYATDDTRIIDPTDTTEDARREFWMLKDGSLVEWLRAEGHGAQLYKDDSANPGEIVAEHWISLTSANTLTDSTATQPLFDGGGGPAGGALTVDTGKYFFECQLNITAMSATSGNGEFELAGTATYDDVRFQVVGIDSTTPLAAATATMSAGDTAATNAASMVTAAVGTALQATIIGQFDITVAGTVIPSIDLVTGGVTPAVNIGSYCKFNRMGATATASTGNWN